MNSNCNDYKIEMYNYLMDSYVEIIHKLIDTSYSMKILPFKVRLGMNYIKKYINDNRFETLQNGITYILTNKELILNFNITNLDDLDEDSDDNTSIKSCVNKLKKQKNINSNQNFDNLNSDDMLNLIIEIKNNSKNLSQTDIVIIKKYFELIIIILEKIQNLFY